MGLRENSEFVFGPSLVKFAPKNTDGSTLLPYPEKTELAAFSGLGPFDFSGAADPSAVPLSIKINDVVETKTLDLTTPPVGNIAAVTVTEFIAAVVVAAFTDVAPTVDARGYGEILASGGGIDPTADYIQVYSEAAELAEFGYGYGAKFIQVDTQQTFAFTPTNVDDEEFEVIDSNNLKTKVIFAGYRDGVTAAMVDTVVDNELRALLTGGTYNPTTKEFVAPLNDVFRPKISIEVANKMYLKNSNQNDDWVGVKVTRAFNMSAREDTSGDGGLAFQTPNFSFTGTAYTDPETSTKYGDSMTKDYTRAEYDLFKYEDI